MKKKLGLWLMMVSVLTLSCGQGRSQGLSRPPLLQERLAPRLVLEQPQWQLIWPRVLMDLGLNEVAPGSEMQIPSSSCVYATALETLRHLRQTFGARGAYVLSWARNQDRVFSACDQRANEPTAPVMLSGKGLPVRARSDYLYQLASWHFYRGDHAAALPVFEQVRRMHGVPQQANAAYMQVRTLAYLNRLEDAYAAIDGVLADPALRDVHRITANYRFVIMSNTNVFASRGQVVIPVSLAKRHLRWLHDMVRVDAERVADPMLAAADAKDAREQLAVYFPYHDRDGSVDWWLQDGQPVSARMQAVKDLARQLPMIDWMQANWATNIFETDWLWALHAPGNPYWQGNATIVAHAWQRWQQEHDGAWLQVATQRVHPADPLAQPILAAAHAYLAHPWSGPRQRETTEYTAWVLALWENAVRLHLGLGDAAGAIALVEQGRDTVRDLEGTADLAPFQRPLGFASTVDRSLRWLVYRGEVEAARTLLAAARLRTPDGLRKWRSLLATHIDEAHAAATVQLGFAGYAGQTNDPSAWERMVDDIGSEFLYRMASDTALQQRYRALFARTALARALMLGYEPGVVDRYAALAGQLNPSMREQVLSGVASHARSDYLRLLLRIPRLRPAVLAEYAQQDETVGRVASDRGLAPEAIDVYNHNDNNWWCAFNPARLRERAFNAWRILPTGGRLFEAPLADAETEPYLAKQRELLEAHPYRRWVDEQELKALSSIPSGPRFLSEAVIARENATVGEPPPQERDGRAADLHRAVRTTRYGCERDGSHADYSRAAFRLLHDRYEDTPWAKATPYWFK